MNILRSCLRISESRNASTERNSAFLAKEVCFPIGHKVRKSNAPICSLERGFKRLGITFHELKSLTTVARGDKDK